MPPAASELRRPAVFASSRRLTTALESGATKVAKSASRQERGEELEEVSGVHDDIVVEVSDRGVHEEGVDELEEVAGIEHAVAVEVHGADGGGGGDADGAAAGVGGDGPEPKPGAARGSTRTAGGQGRR